MWPRAVLHVDGDAFFASVVQAVYPQFKGKPIATGKERGVAIAVSYEAQRYGVKRCMTTWEIKKICPSCIMVNSEFKLYHIFSQRMFDILRTFSPIVEEYSIDEGFVDITDLKNYYKTGYYEIGEIVKQKIEQSLGISISVGISTTKSLSKIASNLDKPSGLIVISPDDIENKLRNLPVLKVWGIGYQTSLKLRSLEIYTALDFIKHSEAFIKKNLSKPYIEIWRELQGTMMYKIDPEPHTDYKSMSKVQTFTPPISDVDILWARLIDRVEEAFEKARKYNYNVGRVSLFLKTQTFKYDSIELKIAEKAAFPYLIKDQLKQGFMKIYKKNTLYRATGCGLYDFEETTTHQASLFCDTNSLEEKMKKIYPLYESGAISFGTELFNKDYHRKKTMENRLRIPMLDLN